MVELCNAERLGWAVLTILTAVVAATPRLYSIFLHGKLRPGASTTSEAGFPLRWLKVEVPKRLFSHFYFFCLASSALVIVDVLVYGGSLVVRRIQVRAIEAKAPATKQRNRSERKGAYSRKRMQ